jgi:hypothetical protein
MVDSSACGIAWALPLPPGPAATFSQAGATARPSWCGEPHGRHDYHPVGAGATARVGVGGR